ncbi:MAG: hypothetical protein H0V29_12415, partial [Thermoleophilaceae bacterium]|nr:hypothetical protein [Thermoleophilaceae bacterium]
IEPCGRLALPAGESHVSVPPGTAMRADHLRLRSNAPNPVAHPAVPGDVVDQGEGSAGKRDGTRLALSGPARVTLAESYSKGWRAFCGERDLGEPRPSDGFANSWEAPADCTNVRFAFAPQRSADFAYAISILGALLLLGLVGLSARRTRPSAIGDQLSARAPADPVIRLRWGPAISVGAAAALIGGFLFALRAGVVIGPVVVLALHFGLTRARLLSVAALGLAVVPLIYVVFPPENRGGFDFNFGAELLGAHWFAVAAVICLGIASALGARAVRRAGRRL